MIDILTTTLDLFLFRSVTNFPRWLEIAHGIIAWALLLIILQCIILIIGGQGGDV